MKRIQLIEMGGTISARGQDRLDLKDYQSGVFHYEDFLRDIPELEDLADYRFTQFSKISSTKIQPSHWLQLRQEIMRSIEAEEADAFVILHGTSTLEETAYFLHLTVPSEKPIVFVGAQRPYTAISSDAQLNLIQAIQLAASDAAKGLGVLVVLNNEIHSARDASKFSTYRLQTFQSHQTGPLGVIDPDNRVQIYRKPTRKHTVDSIFSSLDPPSLPEVAIVYSYAGASGLMIDALVESQAYQGIVTAGSGAGLVTPDELASLIKAQAAGLTIVRSSRVGSGRVVDIAPYQAYPFISGDDLLPQKARILLMLALLVDDDPKAIQAFFDHY